MFRPDSVGPALRSDGCRRSPSARPKSRSSNCHFKTAVFAIVQCRITEAKSGRMPLTRTLVRTGSQGDTAGKDGNAKRRFVIPTRGRIYTLLPALSDRCRRVVAKTFVAIIELFSRARAYISCACLCLRVCVCFHFVFFSY